MKFVYFGYDFMLGGVRRLLEAGHTLGGVFTFECDNVFNFNRDTIALAGQCGVPVIFSRPQDIHIDSLIAEGCDVFLGAGYPYKIPPIPEERAYGINLHPTFLPKGRGIMPTPFVIMNAPEAAGFTIHKLTQDYDAGDILYQEKFEMAPDETVDTYSDRIAEKAPDVLAEIFLDLPRFWKEAKPQDEEEATTFPLPDEDMRTLDWDKSVAQIDATARAFGGYGVNALFDGQEWAVYALEVYEEEHNFKPGEIAERDENAVFIAARDGFVKLKDYQPL